mmetsp:Transcript_51386/g.95003  ORF Transcript_51386/g.95003 Transcript_51386/m.95003 type:complete len:403 (-) Transcript_51386:43-1251(-)
MAYGSESARSPVSARGEESEAPSPRKELTKVRPHSSQGGERKKERVKAPRQYHSEGDLRPSSTPGGTGRHAEIVSRIIARRVASARRSGLYVTEDAWATASPVASKVIAAALELDLKEGGSRSPSPSRPASREQDASRPSSRGQNGTQPKGTSSRPASSTRRKTPAHPLLRQDRDKERELALGEWAASVWGKSDDADSQDGDRNNNPAPAPSRRGLLNQPLATSRARKTPNPFMEYEDREKRWKEEQKLLQADAGYMEQQTQALRQNGAQGRLHMRLERANCSEEEMAEFRILYSLSGMRLLRRRIAKERQAIRAKEPEEPAMLTSKSSVPSSPPGRSQSAPTVRLQSMQREINDSSGRLYRLATTGRASLSSPNLQNSKKKKAGFELLFSRVDAFFDHSQG